MPIQEYKVTVNVKDNTGMLPDFVGEDYIDYYMGSSAKAVQERVKRELALRYSYEIDTGKISVKITVEKVPFTTET